MAPRLLKSRRMRALWVLAFSVMSVDVVRAQQPEEGPRAMVKAIFLFNFVRFTDWPANPEGGPLTLCVFGDPDVAASLGNLISDRPINGRDVTVASIDTFRIVRTCHLLYVAGDDHGRISGALAAVAMLNVFTVGDGEVFARAGGIAALFKENGRTTFGINPDALGRTGLRVRSQMLSLAKVIKEESR